MMATHSSSKYDVTLMPKQEGMDFTSFPLVAHPLLDDFRYSEYSLWHYHCNFTIRDCPFAAMPISSILEPIVDEASFYSSLDIEQSQNVVRGCNAFCGFGNQFGGLDETICGQFGFVTNDIQNENYILVYGDSNKEINHVSMEAVLEDERDKNTRGEEKSGVSKMLCRETISKYFYMPISQATKEMNIGLTSLKERCRELGIRRWPHRKLKSLETLIKNVQDLGKDQGVAQMSEVIKALENEKKMMEEAPDLQLDETTKRLRQTCSKANYKKRRLM